MLRDAPETVEDDETVDDEADEIYCVGCGHLVTRGRWRIAMDGNHEHTFFNPAGIVFRVLCFKEAPGALPVGSVTAEFSWFDGHTWRIAICGGCGDHLGWMFEGAGAFFGLVKPRLTMRRPT